VLDPMLHGGRPHEGRSAPSEFVRVDMHRNLQIQEGGKPARHVVDRCAVAVANAPRRDSGRVRDSTDAEATTAAASTSAKSCSESDVESFTPGCCCIRTWQCCVVCPP